MSYVYIDEKGPQETIRIAKDFSHEKRLNLADDNMSSYVANLFSVKNSVKGKVEDEYKKIINGFERQNKSSELKGQQILKSHFNYGIANMHTKEVNFYTELLKILIENDCSNLCFAISKFSIVVNVRFSKWLLELQRDRHIHNVHLIKYSITKFFEIESSQELNELLFDNNISNKEFISALIKELKEFIDIHSRNKRMEMQISEYKNMVKVFKQHKHRLSEIDFDEVQFDWEQFKWSIDLWVTENKVVNNWEGEENQLFLDEGIPDLGFSELGFTDVLKGQESHQHIGLQITDMLVALIGKQITKMGSALRYDAENPSVTTNLPKEWFEMDEENYKLICLLNKYLNQGQYSLIYDTFFDDLLIFTSYLEYISSFANYYDFKKGLNHSKGCRDKMMSDSEIRWLKFIEITKVCNDLFGSVLGAINEGELKNI
ncbi:hypothetical protein G7081_03455 [Vagococcus coleopterorum]|uniref:Uncharacterized protein n=1 Tax=Vagococcus coleopterorum TaxID=2714946 RepID=A0A6G8AM84_9ENTE|nr:hypothetical protein [Vagococcus coleopterorum]QIL46194.1 hypothetical protein G7081_03455 [Vagococcus coleopterorum]